MSSADSTHNNPAARPGMTPRDVIIFTLIIIFVIIALGALSAPMVMRSQTKSELTEALTNARQIGMALSEFAHEYGRFPDAQTATIVADNTNSTLAPPGRSANAYLRQLIAADIVNTEMIFHAKTAFTHKPDNISDTTETTLAPGELGFGYVLNGNTGFSTNINPNIIILCAPLAFDGKTVSSTRLDTGPFDGRGVILRIDNSATTHNIDPTSRELITEGKPWLATGADTIWGTDITPRIATPEPR